MKFPKMSAWVVVGGIVIWVVLTNVNSMTFLSRLHLIDTRQESHRYVGGCNWNGSNCVTNDEGDSAGGFLEQLEESFLYPMNLLWVGISPLSIFVVIFFTPYISIPFWWFILHQIDKAMKRRRGRPSCVRDLIPQPPLR